MEDNIGDMMVEIRDVVSNHLSDVKKEFTDTLNVINTLPLVIALRKKIRKLENENKQLKMLIDGIGEEKNIELEIMEVPKNDTSLEDGTKSSSFEEDDQGAPDDGSDAESMGESDDNSDGEFDVLRADYADENELGIVIDDKTSVANEEGEEIEKLIISNNDNAEDI
jgi:hypothetical protein